MADAPVHLHPHALARLAERGVAEAEAVATVRTGEDAPAKHGRTLFRRNFAGPWDWRGRRFDTKQVEAYAVWEDESWFVITVIARYF